MKGRKLYLLYLSMSLACTIPILALLFMASSRQAGSTISWFHLMECFTPTLILELALIIYFIRKARVA